jgi:lysophospholipase L1-like esterase
MSTLLQSLITWLALPVYVWQGLKVRKNTMRMPPPPHDGWLHHAFEGERDEPLKILVIGDSSAAGVGVSDIADSLGGQLAPLLSERLERPVSVRIAGMNSAMSGQIRDFVVPHIEPDGFDYIALNIGTNDTKNLHTAGRFKRDFGTLIYALKARFPSARIIWAGILDMERVPALPSPLNRLMGIRARILREKGMTLCAERGVLAPESDWRIVRENFSEDGFHASARGYHEWAQNLATLIATMEKA